jgi:hypothetical protein
MEEKEEKNDGMTILELKNFLNSLPINFDTFTIVNGEVSTLGENYYVRIDKPVIHLEIDENSKELLILHQTEEELKNIEESINGNTK